MFYADGNWVSRPRWRRCSVHCPLRDRHSRPLLADVLAGERQLLDGAREGSFEVTTACSTSRVCRTRFGGFFKAFFVRHPDAAGGERSAKLLVNKLSSPWTCWSFSE
jgi:hypothetical protein